jgi:hypothetical protein
MTIGFTKSHDSVLWTILHYVTLVACPFLDVEAFLYSGSDGPTLRTSILTGLFYAGAAATLSLAIRMRKARRQ